MRMIYLLQVCVNYNVLAVVSLSHSLSLFLIVAPLRIGEYCVCECLLLLVLVKEHLLLRLVTIMVDLCD